MYLCLHKSWPAQRFIFCCAAIFTANKIKMKKNNTSAKILLLLAGFGFISVALQAFYNPQLVMDFVQTPLTNVSARNSIRANYGGMNMALGLFMLYAAFKKQNIGLLFLSLFTGGFFIGRMAGFVLEGAANDFVHSWAIMEGLLCVGSIWLLRRRQDFIVSSTSFVQ
jgi:hypothetical protein